MKKSPEKLGEDIEKVNELVSKDIHGCVAAWQLTYKRYISPEKGVRPSLVSDRDRGTQAMRQALHELKPVKNKDYIGIQDDLESLMRFQWHYRGQIKQQTQGVSDDNYFVAVLRAVQHIIDTETHEICHAMQHAMQRLGYTDIDVARSFIVIAKAYHILNNEDFWAEHDKFKSIRADAYKVLGQTEFGQRPEFTLTPQEEYDYIAAQNQKTNLHKSIENTAVELKKLRAPTKELVLQKLYAKRVAKQINHSQRYATSKKAHNEKGNACNIYIPYKTKDMQQAKKKLVKYRDEINGYKSSGQQLLFS